MTFESGSTLILPNPSSLDSMVDFSVDDILNEVDILAESEWMSTAATIEKLPDHVSIPVSPEHYSSGFTSTDIAVEAALEAAKAQTCFIVPNPVSPATSMTPNTPTAPVVATVSRSNSTVAMAAAAAAAATAASAEPSAIVSPTPETTVSQPTPAVAKRAATTAAAPATSKKRRRSVSSVSEDGSSDAERTEQQRRERNREHAKRSRQRKKSLTENLQASVAALKAENEKLRQLVLQHNVSQSEINAQVQKFSLTPTDRFVASLKKNTNKVIRDGATLNFLKSLRANVNVPPAVQK